jgi:hypothetical protein
MPLNTNGTLSACSLPLRRTQYGTGQAQMGVV